MRKLRLKIGYISLVCLLLVFLFRGYIYRQLFVYELIETRKTYTEVGEGLKQYLNEETSTFKPQNIHEVVEKSLQITARTLRFRPTQPSSDPNALLISQEAHCVGYAAFFTTTCNYLLQKYQLDSTWKAKHWVGKIKFCGKDLHRFLSSPFFKDHDLAAVEDIQTGESLYVDPSLKDYFYINYIRVKAQ